MELKYKKGIWPVAPAGMKRKAVKVQAVEAILEWKRRCEAAVEEVRSIVEEMSEEAFRHTPMEEGDWGAREVLAHLAGAAEGGYVAVLRAARESGSEPVDFARELVFDWESRAELSKAELLGLVEAEYASMRKLLGELTEKDLEREIFVPSLEETPLTARPTLGALVEGLSIRHVEGHAKQLRRLTA